MVRVKNNGSIWIFHLSGEVEVKRVKKNVGVPDWGWLSPTSFVCEPRCGVSLVEGLRTEGGFEVVDYDEPAPAPPPPQPVKTKPSHLRLVHSVKTVAKPARTRKAR